MRVRFECSCVFFQTLLPLVLVLASGLPADAQCTIQQIDKLLPDDLGPGYWFGYSSAAVSENIAIISGGGAAYLFDTTTGNQIHKLQPEDGGSFGNSVAISGGTAIVGRRTDSTNGESAGAAYLFDTSTGKQIAKILPEDGDAGDRFGISVGISGTKAIVGAWWDDDNGNNSGSAYIFDAMTGQQTLKLLPDDGWEEDVFGSSVAISGNTAIVGATCDDDNGLGSGSAYLFDATTGQQIAKLLAEDGDINDFFGGDEKGVAIDGTVAVISARGDGYGSAYVFDTSTGQQIAKLLPDEIAEGFGSEVAISGNTVVVGAPQDDDNGPFSGAAFFFDATTGKQIAKVLPDDNDGGDLFGVSVGIGGNTAVFGAGGSDDAGASSGSAYVFVISCSSSVTADLFDVFRGFHVSGQLSDTFHSDDSYLKFNPGLTINSAEPPVWIKFEGTLPSDSPTSLSVTLEAQAGTTGLTQTVEMFNWNTSQYELVDSQSASWNEDSIVTVDLSAFVSDYVQAGTGAVETRVGWNDTGPILNYPWTICIDQVVWTVTQ